jgi:alpha-tubulin suppressor-like RCC1 family protein
VLVDGGVSCWGDGRETPERLAGLPPATQVALSASAADGHACALTADNELWCWGRNDYGQLGDGSRTASAVPVRVLPPASTEPVPVVVEEPTGDVFRVEELAVGYDQTCARRGGSVWCWGRPPAAPINPAPPDLLRPAPLPGLDDVVQLAAGFGFFCARRENGTVVCWGENTYGQLGDGTTESRTTPVPVAGLDRAENLVADYGRACARRSGGEVWCWGEGKPTAAPVEALRPWRGSIRQLALSDGHWCVLLAGGEVRCQGNNDHGQIGNGEGGCRPDPAGIPCGPPDSACLPPQICAEAPEFVAVRELAPAVELALGSGFSCARHENGTVSCWGWNHQGQLGRGYGFAEAEGWLPAAVEGLDDATSLRADAGRVCALKSDGTAVCWGQNVFGELGDRTTQLRPAPSPVHGLTSVIDLGAGQNHTCARTTEHFVWCWGDNDHGQLGDGSLERRPAPVLVRTL